MCGSRRIIPHIVCHDGHMLMICNMHSLTFFFFGFYLLILRFSLVTPLLKYEACFEVIYVQYIMNEWIFEHCIWVVSWAAGHL